MKYLSEYRDKNLANALAASISQRISRPWVLMEVCGGQTHSIVKYALDQFLPDQLQLVHGPGCPVCVTAQETIDQAISLARQPDIIFCSFGDMLRVPGTTMSLNQAKGMGADVRMLYSPLDALTIARDNPGKRVVFFAVGFETTAPATAMALAQARQMGLKNLFALVSHFLVPPAITAILNDAGNRVQGFLAPGHVCAITGVSDYETLTARYRVPIVITGFEPADILRGILRCIELLEEGRPMVDNQYRRVVDDKGNTAALQLVGKVFQVADQVWRGIGNIRDSGLQLTPEYRDFDASAMLEGLPRPAVDRSTRCISGDILRGVCKPPDCPHFGKACRPEHPLGAPMVSAEGACAAYFHYR